MCLHLLHLFFFQYAFLLTSSVLFAGGVINFFGLVSTPKEIGIGIELSTASSEFHQNVSV